MKRIKKYFFIKTNNKQLNAELDKTYHGKNSNIHYNPIIVPCTKQVIKI